MQPESDSVMYTVRKSLPPNAQLVVPKPRGDLTTAIGWPNALCIQTSPMPVWQTTTPLAFVNAKPSGPARPPENCKKRPALLTLPLGDNGSRHTALARVTAK